MAEGWRGIFFCSLCEEREGKEGETVEEKCGRGEQRSKDVREEACKQGSSEAQHHMDHQRERTRPLAGASMRGSSFLCLCLSLQSLFSLQLWLCAAVRTVCVVEETTAIDRERWVRL